MSGACPRSKQLSNYFGVPPPSKKHQTESEPQKKRAFAEKWLQEVGWLQTNDERTEMWCRLCCENSSLADKNSAFYIGTKNVNHPAFDKHTNSREHQKVVLCCV
uniref:C17orf113 probable zinc finger domain-containing protein n=1 Tax=Nothobranchius pienaari TaxID=704102 RepID=A0A1A8MDC1_9TELE